MEGQNLRCQYATVSTDIFVQTSHQLNLATADELEIISIFSSAGSWTEQVYSTNACGFTCTS